MSLKPGTRLGPYEILAQLGAGGMGEVYKGRDIRLDRLVALKVLAPHLAGNAEARERFEREATTVAKLKHAHICLLYDIGHQEVAAEDSGVAPPSRRPLEPAGSRRYVGIDYLVLEYLEGETLAQRLAKGPLPLEQVLQYSIEIADALDKAHRAGVTHRDIKPGNIMVVPSSETASKTETKLLDFGLAKLKQDAVPANLADLPRNEWPTGVGAPTAQGTVLGTAQYMAPEQVEGKVNELDARTDIFSFGATVYEMATGKKAFDGQSQASIMAAILKEDPPPVSSADPPGKLSSPALDRVVKQCLAKDPNDRWQTAADLCRELKWIATGGGQVLSGVEGPAPLKRRERIAWGIAAIVILLLGALAAVHFWEAPPESPPISFTIPAPENGDFVQNTSVAVSPDGTQVAFAATAEGKQLLWVRSLASLTARPLPGTENAVNPFWSPDGQYLGFFAEGKLLKIAVSGGPAQPLGDTLGRGAGRTGTWNREGTILFTSRGTGVALQRVSAAGGQPTAVTAMDTLRQETGHSSPSFLPDGHHFLYYARSARPENNAVFLGSLESTEARVLLQADSGAIYASPGYLFFLRGNILVAQAFDAERLELSGEPFPIAEAVLTDPNVGSPAFSVSDNGVLAYRSLQQEMQLAWVDREGKQVGSVGPPGEYRNVALSPDERRIVIDRYDAGNRRVRDLWLYDLARSTSSRLTFDPADDFEGLWSPDGEQIVFGSNRGGSGGLYRKSASGVGQEDMVVQTGGAQNRPRDWSSDGRFVVYENLDAKTGYDLWVLPLFDDPRQAGTEGRKPIPYLITQFAEMEGRFSPNGRWIAYHSNESGRTEIYVQPFPTSAGKWQISTDGGYMPLWSRDGKELFYFATDGEFMAVSVNAGTTFEAGVPKRLFQTIFSGVPTGGLQRYAVSADGQRFLMNVPTGEGADSPITVVVNWLAGIRKQ